MKDKSEDILHEQISNTAVGPTLGSKGLSSKVESDPCWVSLYNEGLGKTPFAANWN